MALQQSAQCPTGTDLTEMSFLCMPILGQAFMRKYYASFDTSTGRIGLALSNQNQNWIHSNAGTTRRGAPQIASIVIGFMLLIVLATQH